MVGTACAARSKTPPVASVLRESRFGYWLRRGNRAMDEAQLLDHGRRENERIRVSLAQAAVQVVEHVGERMPVGGDLVEGLLAFAFRHGDLLQAGFVGARRAQREPASGGALARIWTVEVVRPGLRPVLPGMRGGVGADEAPLPVC